MSPISNLVRRQARRLLSALLAGGSLLIAGCATHYLDGSMKDLPAAAFNRPAQPVPVQMLFEFQTNGKANARATEHVKPMAQEAVKETGLFATVAETPQPSGAILSVTIDNIALIDDAVRKGFMTGLTFGAVGSTVTDGYVCTVRYLTAPTGMTLVKTSKHAIHTAMGSGTAPTGGVRAESIEQAVKTMVRQAVGAALSDLSRDQSFK